MVPDNNLKRIFDDYDPDVVNTEINEIIGWVYDADLVPRNWFLRN